MVRGVDIAIDQTIKIAQHLNRGSDQELRKKLLESIFDDQLKAHTDFNRQQRHNARRMLKKALQEYESQ